LPLVFHAGESVDAANENLFDALLLGTKRIGHGFNLALHPHLQELVKQRQVCIECCPVSNLILGYTLDLRCHPVRAFLHQGIPVSISPDDPGFFDYEGVTLDYVYAFLAWELDLADLKKLCLNSLEFASISAEEKAKILPLFNEKWTQFCEFVKSKY
jgi:adenosine deaminase CECR1